MTTDQLYHVWWQNADEGEQVMEESHRRFWQKVVSMVIEDDLRHSSVLDFGCNQGGFLRYLYEQKPFKNGVGVDIARGSVEVANQRKGALPLTYEATSTPEKFSHQFDLAFSISVIYLIADLQAHACTIRQMLKPGGVYYATYTDYNGNPSLPVMKKQIDRHAARPMILHDLDDIAGAFFQEGFQVGIRRLLPNGFIDLSPQERFFQKIAHRMQYEYEQACIFRCVAPQ